MPAQIGQQFSDVLSFSDGFAFFLNPTDLRIANEKLNFLDQVATFANSGQISQPGDNLLFSDNFQHRTDNFLSLSDHLTFSDSLQQTLFPGADSQVLADSLQFSDSFKHSLTLSIHLTDQLAFSDVAPSTSTVTFVDGYIRRYLNDVIS